MLQASSIFSLSFSCCGLLFSRGRGEARSGGDALVFRCGSSHSPNEFTGQISSPTPNSSLRFLLLLRSLGLFDLLDRFVGLHYKLSHRGKIDMVCLCTMRKEDFSGFILFVHD